MPIRTAGLCMLLSGYVGAAAAAQSDCLIDDYLRALEQTQQVEATADDVDRLMNYYADEVVYEHARVGATIRGKEQLSQGMRSYLGQTRNSKITVDKVISADDVVVIEYDRSYQYLADGSWHDKVQHQLTIFQIADSQITRVQDYW